MKILLINSLYYPNQVGGAERSVQFLAEALVEAGHRTTVLSTSPASKLREGEVNGVRVYYVPLKNLYWPFRSEISDIAKVVKPIWHACDAYNPWMTRAVRNVLNAEKPDLVHTHNLAGFSTAVWKEIKEQNLPLIHTLRDYYLLCPKTTMFRGERNCDYQCFDCKGFSVPKSFHIGCVDGVVGISRFILERHLSFGYFAKTPIKDVIPNAYDLNPCRTQQKKYDRARSKLRIGFLGRLVPSKGIEHLLEVCERWSADNLELLVGGEGETDYVSYLQNRYVLPNCTYLGRVKPEQFFSQVDILVVPSLWREPMGRVVIEAYGYGVPVIASSRGGIPEIIDEGETGFLFKPEQPKSLERAVKRFFEDPKLLTKMRPHLLAKANTFLPKTIASRHVDLYRSVLAG